MHPIRRVAFHVLLQAVEDVRRGAKLPAGQMQTLADWAAVAGIRESRLRATLEWARAGNMANIAPAIDPAYRDPFMLQERVQQYLTHAAP